MLVSQYATGLAENHKTNEIGAETTRKETGKESPRDLKKQRGQRTKCDCLWRGLVVQALRRKNTSNLITGHKGMHGKKEDNEPRGNQSDFWYSKRGISKETQLGGGEVGRGRQRISSKGAPCQREKTASKDHHRKKNCSNVDGVGRHFGSRRIKRAVARPEKTS